MKTTFFLLYLLIASIVVASAQNYRVVYKAHVPNDIGAVQKEREKNSNTQADKSSIEKLFNEAMKSLDNRLLFSGICTPSGQYFKVDMAAPQDDNAPNNIVSFNIDKSKVSILHNYNDYYTAIIKERNGGRDTSYRLLDTAGMCMVATNTTREYGGRKCTEYIPCNQHYRYFSLWADTTLPAYVHSCSFWGLGVNGGIVAITFKDSESSITLESIEETGDPILRLSWYEKPAFLYLPFGKTISNYQSLQLPD